MAWPKIPSIITTDQVAWSQLTGWTQDAALGRVPTYGNSSGPYNCVVQPDESSMLDEHGRQAMVVRHSVIMLTNPGIKIRDQLVWQETGAILTVISVRPTGDATGRIWEIDCEERPTS